MIFSVVNSALNFGWAKNFLLPTNFSIDSWASSFFILNGNTTSGTAPLGICWFKESVLRHQWHLAWVEDDVSITTSAPQLVHFKVTISSVDAIFLAPEAITWPSSLLISFSKPDTFSTSNSWRQKLHLSLPLFLFNDISVEPHLGHLSWPLISPSSVFTILASSSTLFTSFTSFIL